MGRLPKLERGKRFSFYIPTDEEILTDVQLEVLKEENNLSLVILNFLSLYADKQIERKNRIADDIKEILNIEDSTFEKVQESKNKDKANKNNNDNLNEKSNDTQDTVNKTPNLDFNKKTNSDLSKDTVSMSEVRIPVGDVNRDLSIGSEKILSDNINRENKDINSEVNKELINSPNVVQQKRRKRLGGGLKAQSINK